MKMIDTQSWNNLVHRTQKMNEDIAALRVAIKFAVAENKIPENDSYTLLVLQNRTELDLMELQNQIRRLIT